MNERFGPPQENTDYPYYCVVAIEPSEVDPRRSFGISGIDDLPSEEEALWNIAHGAVKQVRPHCDGERFAFFIFDDFEQTKAAVNKMMLTTRQTIDQIITPEELN